MKVKRLLLLILAVFFMGAATVFADEAFEWYKGKKVKVIVNNEELSGGGLSIEMDGTGKTLLPLRDIADTLQAVVKWDEETRTVHLYKPNVHLVPLIQLDDKGSYGFFGTVPHNETSSFLINVQIDNIMTPVEGLKFVISDPEGEMLFEQFADKEYLLKESKKGYMWLRSNVFTHHFSQLGKYMIKVYLKAEGQEEYYLVSEKALYSTK